MRLRCIILSIIACLAVSAAAQDLSQQIDYTTKASPLHRVLQALSDKTHVNLQCSPDLDDEPLILRLKNVPLQTAMDKIASVFGGEWTKTGNSLELRLSKRADEMHAALIDARTKLEQDAINLAIKLNTYAEPYTEAYARKTVVAWRDMYASNRVAPDGAIERNTPGSRLVAVALKHIDPRAIAQLESYGTITYSTQPNELEVPLNGMDEAIDTFLEQQAWMTSAIDELAPTSLKKLLHDNFGKMPKSAHPRIVLTIQEARDRYRNGGLLVLDDDGSQVASAPIDVSPSQTPTEADTTAAKSDGIIANIGSPSDRVMDYLTRKKKDINTTLDDDLKEFFLAPSGFEPLSLRTSDLILDLADKHNVNAVVLPPENGEQCTFESAPDGKCDLQSLQQSFKEKAGTTLDIADGWLIGGPDDPLQSVRTHFPREVAQNYLRAIADRKYAIIEDGAALESAIHPDTIRDAVGIGRVCLGVKQYPWIEYDQRRLLALFGTLNETQLHQASETLRVTPDQLTSDQINLIVDWVTHTSTSAQIDYPDDTPPDFPYYPPILSDLVANGLAHGSYLDITDRTEPLLAYYSKKELRKSLLRPQTADVNNVAWLVANKANPKSWASTMDLDNVFYVRKRTITFHLKLGKYAYLENTLEEDPMVTGEPMTVQEFIEKLTPAERAKYQQALAEAQQSIARDAGSADAPPLPPPDAPPIGVTHTARRLAHSS